MPTLFEITNDNAELWRLLESGEIPDEEIEAKVWDWLVNADIAFDQKAEAYAAVIREHETRAEIRKAEAARIAELAKADANRAAKLKQFLMHSMGSLGKRKIETPRFRISIQGNGGLQPMQITNLGRVPPEFLKQPEPVPDTDKIRKALEGGEILEFAELLPRGKRLAIK